MCRAEHAPSRRDERRSARQEGGAAYLCGAGTAGSFPDTLRLPSSCPPLLKAEAQDELCRADHTPISEKPRENATTWHSSPRGINLQALARRTDRWAAPQAEVAPLVRTGSPLGSVDWLPGLGRQADRRHARMCEVGVVGRAPVKRRVRAAAIVEIEVAPDPISCRRDAVVGV